MVLIDDHIIEEIEKILLPEGFCFSEEAKAVINSWESNDIVACPGSGKTTVLLAKLKILADQMPLDNGAGICVLSHTNVAVNEVKTRLAAYASKLTSYPNYIGTIQSFIDQFITLPYIKRKTGHSVLPVDDRTYAEHLERIILKKGYKVLHACIRRAFSTSGDQYADIVDFIQTLHLDADDSLCSKKVLAKKDKPSAIQFACALKDMLNVEGLIRYSDAFTYAKTAVEEFGSDYTELFSKRFRYVFIDEYQDCNTVQEEILLKIFDPQACCIMRIGDLDQAIYGSINDYHAAWQPRDGYLPITVSNRYNQEIADVLTLLRTTQEKIHASTGPSGNKPVLFVFDKNCVSKVLQEFIAQLDNQGLFSPDGVYKAVGWIRKQSGKNLTLGTYWEKFVPDPKKDISNYRYWAFIDKICASLNDGDIYKAELHIRKLICRIFHYAGIHRNKQGDEYSVSTLKTRLDVAFADTYRRGIIQFVEQPTYDRSSIDSAFRDLLRTLLFGYPKSGDAVMKELPSFFMDESYIKEPITPTDHNIYVEPIHKRCIQFATIHAVKGETHDATLYLETEYQRSSDIARILPYLGVGKAGSSQLYDYSRKLAYVGMSRPRHLLCVAIQDTTFAKSKDAFKDWKIVDLRLATQA